jgi:hypothetical protein
MWLAEQTSPETLPSATCFVHHRALNSRKGLAICQLLLIQEGAAKLSFTCETRAYQDESRQ